jgi:dTDP-4-amino-4,6-dideoxygalactose transaminase
LRQQALGPIPFNRPAFPAAAFDHMRAAIEHQYLAGDGHFTRLCEGWIEQRLGVGRALLTTSCTSSLEMALMLLDLGPGDEVILPSFTFVSCANAVVRGGATPVFADIDPDSLSLSTATIEQRLTSRTRAVMTVHYGGASRDVQAVADLCRDRGLVLVEDAAHGFLGTADGRPLGSFGSMGTFSFHETKNFSMGEGGAIVLSDAKLIERAEIIREKGTNRKQFFKGLVDKYSWVDVGSSYVASDLLAALLWAQLEVADQIAVDRRHSWERYDRALRPWAVKRGIQTPLRASGSAHHTYFLIAPTEANRDSLIAHMKSFGISAVFHYLPLEQSPYGRRFVQTTNPIASDIASRLVRLPLFPQMADIEIDRTIESVKSFPW